MPLPIFLDSNVLSKLVLPLKEQDPITDAIDRLLDDIRFKVYVPEIIDYEFRRKLLHLSRRPHQARRWARPPDPDPGAPSYVDPPAAPR